VQEELHQHEFCDLYGKMRALGERVIVFHDNISIGTTLLNFLAGAVIWCEICCEDCSILWPFSRTFCQTRFYEALLMKSDAS
jgi:hypothetical protein